MAKVTITVDTETKEISATVNGETIDNLSSAEIYRYMDTNYYESKIEEKVRVELCKREDKEDVKTTYCLYASKVEKVVENPHQKLTDDFFKCLNITK